MLFSRLLLLALIVALFAFETSAKGLWGSKRKKQDEAEEAEVDIGGETGFEASRRKAARASGGTSAGGSGSTLSKRSRSSEMNGVGSEIRSVVDLYISMLEEILLSPDFDKYVTPDAIQNMVAQIPGLTENPQIVAMLAAPELNDPVLLKQTLREGISAIRGYTDEIVELFSSPEKMEELISQLPADAREPARSLMRGDTSGIISMLDTVPGLTQAQKKLVTQLLKGNFAGMQDNLAEMLEDPETVESTRQQLLEHPEMVEMFGITLDVLEDKDRFAAFMRKGMDVLTDKDASSSEKASTATMAAKRLFGAARNA